jgi:ATP-dependent Lhr-like helicase
MFFRQVVDALGSRGERRRVVLALWELVWSGLVTNDTLGGLRALVSGAGRRRSPSTTRRARRGPAFPSRLGPPIAAGRWSLLPPREPIPPAGSMRPPNSSSSATAS